jgi:lysozyme
MKKFLLIFLLPLAGFAQSDMDYRREVQKYEGYSEIPYKDGSCYAVGLGHRIYGEIKRSYTTAEIDDFFDADLQRLVRVCRYGVYSFDTLPADIKQVCVGLAWTVGEQGFVDFQKFREAVSRRNYRQAAIELRGSKWYSQVGLKRSTNYINTLNTQ